MFVLSLFLVVCKMAGRMSFSCYFCFLAYSGVQHILGCAWVFFLSASCVPYVASFSGLSTPDCPCGVF